MTSTDSLPNAAKHFHATLHPLLPNLQWVLCYSELYANSYFKPCNQNPLCLASIHYHDKGNQLCANHV